MRRSMFALLVSVTTVVAPLAPLVSANGVDEPTRATLALTTAAHRPLHQFGPLRRHVAVPDPIQHALAVTAAAMRVTIDQLRAKWQQVAVCEVNGDWSMTGPTYSGIGFANATWSQYGGTKYAPLAGLATRDQQILIGMRITNGQIPDQNGCSPTGW